MKSKTRLIAGIAAAAAIAAPAHAADLPPPVYRPAPVAVQEFSGWYLRGDIGMTNQKVKTLDNVLFATTSVDILQKDFSSSPLFGLGIGYQYNDWLRFDVTGEYRGGATFRGLDTYPGGANDYYATKKEWLYMVNAYVDLGTWWCFTPFIGAGIGLSYNTIDNFRDVNVPNLGVAYGKSNSQWETAWALHAGLAYRVNKNFTAEFAYRYLNLGDAASGDLITYQGVSTVVNPMIFKDITSHDFKLALRWSLGANDFASAPMISQPVYAPAPAPAPVYAPAPAPVYAPPPPLMRKG